MIIHLIVIIKWFRGFKTCNHCLDAIYNHPLRLTIFYICIVYQSQRKISNCFSQYDVTLMNLKLSIVILHVNIFISKSENRKELRAQFNVKYQTIHILW